MNRRVQFVNACARTALVLSAFACRTAGGPKPLVHEARGTNGELSKPVSQSDQNIVQSARCLDGIDARADLPPNLENVAPDTAALSARLGNSTEDSALIFAIEEYGGDDAHRWVGAMQSAAAWERFFKQSLGIPENKVQRIHPLDGSSGYLREQIAKVTTLASPKGRAWLVLVGLATRTRDGSLALYKNESLSRIISWANQGRNQPIIIVDAAIEPTTTDKSQPAVAERPNPIVFSPLSRGVLLGSVISNDAPATYPGTLTPAFSYLMLGALRGWADADHDGRVTWNEVWNYTGRKLAELFPAAHCIRSAQPDKSRGQLVLVSASEPEPPSVAHIARDTISFNHEGLILPELRMQPRLSSEWANPNYFSQCFAGISSHDAEQEQLNPPDEVYDKCPKGTSVGMWANRWCSIGAWRCGNRYALRAHDFCVHLRRYGEQKVRIINALGRDWPVLEDALQKAPPQQMVQLIRAFRQSYPMLDDIGLIGALERTCRKYVEGPTAVASAPLPDGVQWVTLDGGVDWRRGFIPEYPPREPRLAIDGEPKDRVLISRFEILKTEVTAAQYRLCVRKRVCSAPVAPSDSAHRTYGAAGRENHPVNYVSWSQAKTFCEWIGGRLPSETEWTYAARSRGKHLWPWGDKDDCSRSVKFQLSELGPVCGSEDAGSSAVCSHPTGNSEQGLCDLAGNVAEWVADGVHPNFCGAPADGAAWGNGDERHRIIKGGSWHDNYGDPSLRIAAPATLQDSDIGFRCVRDR